MPRIVPISDLRNKTQEITDLCHQGEPVFVTRNGEGELVVMSQALYEQMVARVELYQKLEEAEASEIAGDKGRLHADVIKSLSRRLA